MNSDTILVVDDEPSLRRSLGRLLKRMGHAVEDVPNGEAALASIRQNAPCLMLLDVQMPGMSGVQVLQKVRQTWPELPIILMSGGVETKVPPSSRHDGCLVVLDKPFDKDELRQAVQRLLNRGVPRAD